MIRPFTCVCMMMAAGSGLYLYQTKHRAQLLDHEIARTYRQIDVTRDRITQLKGEWAVQNEPDRLSELVQQHTTLKTLAPTQFVSLADLPGRLPAPLPPGPPAIPPEEAPPMPPPVPVAQAKPPTRIAANDRPAPDKPAAPVASVPVAPVPPAGAVAHAAPRPPVPPSPSLSAANGPAPFPAPSLPAPSLPAPSLLSPRTAPPPPVPRILAPVVNVSVAAVQPDAARGTARGSVGDGVARAAQLRQPAPQVLSAATPAYPAPSYQAPSYSASSYAAPAYAAPTYPAVGSALGSAAHTALPPPVPFGAAGGR